jgi:hypothetical protein
MAPKRSDDPEAQDLAAQSPPASEYWDADRRRAARPAEIRRDPGESSTDSVRDGASCDPADESAGTTSEDGDTATESSAD